MAGEDPTEHRQGEVGGQRSGQDGDGDEVQSQASPSGQVLMMKRMRKGDDAGGHLIRGSSLSIEELPLEVKNTRLQD